jgi:DNA-binding GntR family transcriptional regulator
MARLGVGRTPLREALQALTREGLVETYPRRGMTVAPVDAAQLASLSEVRVVLEGLAARLAAERATPEERVETSALRAALERAADEQERRDRRTLIELDQRIHRHVYECTHNELLAQTLDRYYVLTLRIWFLALDRIPALDEAVQEHQALLAAIRDRRPARAERFAREHVVAFQQAIREVL